MTGIGNNSNMQYFKALIRVVKSLSNNGCGYGIVDQIREPLIIAENKEEVKTYLLNKYPQFFQNNKIYEKETKNDKAQFFYVVIFPLYKHEINLINEGQWKCSYCGQIHENKYISKPITDERLLGSDFLFCRSEENTCLNNYKKEKFKSIDLSDDLRYIKKDSINYIYKITEKSTNKCYIGKTRNAPFFRWWNHLNHSGTPFGLYLHQTKLSNWTFEVLEELPHDISDSEILRIESEYIVKFNSINNGFNTLISNNNVLNDFGNLKLEFED